MHSQVKLRALLWITQETPLTCCDKTLRAAEYSEELCTLFRGDKFSPLGHYQRIREFQVSDGRDDDHRAQNGRFKNFHGVGSGLIFETPSGADRVIENKRRQTRRPAWISSLTLKSGSRTTPPPGIAEFQ